MERCPVCEGNFASDILETHVNTCLDQQEHKRHSPVATPVATKRSADGATAPKSALEALGLRLDSSESGKRRRRAPRTPSGASMSQLVKTERTKLNLSARDSSVATLTQGATPTPAAPPKETLAELTRQSKLPLALRLRPKLLAEFQGQEKLLGEHGLLTNIVASNNIPSFILWGPPGIGKTSLARIIAETTSDRFVEVSGVDGTAKKLREVFQAAENEKRLTGRKTILFLDEIHRYNKALQDLLLPVVERGVVTVIGATTENPSFTINNALLSRMHTFVMEPLLHDALVKVLIRAIRVVNRTRKLVHNLHLIDLDRGAIDYIAKLSTGDLRVALNILESVHAYLSGRRYSQFDTLEPAKELIRVPLAQEAGVIRVTADHLKPLLSLKNYHQMYDRQGDLHYDTISAFHKSVRGSDANAAVFYLVKMLQGGEDPVFILRRMIVIASEDIGLRDSSCLPFMLAAKEAFEFVGMPEGEIILSHCATKLARAHKLTKSYRALRNVQQMFKDNPDLANVKIPLHLRNSPTALMKELGYGEDYKYNPSFENGKVSQSYLPPELSAKGIDTNFVEPHHLGQIRDPKVKSEDYEIAAAELKDYEDYKRQRNAFIQQKEIVMERPTYDEFLPAADQPAFYIDAEEKNTYLDDPDCSHNFETEPNHDPHHYQEDDTFHYDPEYPIFYD
jgi:putative ATPase